MRSKAVNTLTIVIRADEPERLLNMASFHGIVLRRVSGTARGIEAVVGVSDFKRLCRLRKKAGASVKVLKRRGPYFVWKKTRHRRAGMLCGVLSFASLYVMSLFVWDISFEGNLRYTDSYLLDYVKKDGCLPGALISSVSCEELEKDLRDSFSDITWVSARIEGTRLVVEIEENNTAGMGFQENEPCSLRAAHSGTVSSIVTRQGTPMVKEGDVVEEGDLLVSGRIPIYDDSQEVIAYQLTSASADVLINYEENFYVEIPRMQKTRRYTSTRKLPGIIIFDRRFCLPGSLDTDGELYIEQVQLKLFDNLYLPVYVEEYSLRSYEEVQVSYDDESLRQQARQKYLEFVLQLEKLGVEIIENNVTIENGLDNCVMEGTLTLRANAAVQSELEEQSF